MKIYTPIDYDWNRTRLAQFIARHGYGSLEQLQEQAEADPRGFWDRVVADLEVEWTTPYAQTLDLRDGIMWPKWFEGGRLDLVDNLIGKHARRNPHKIAVRWEGDGGETRSISYAALALEVGRLASGLTALGIGAGDRIALYLPMIPEAVAVMLAATRIGAVFVPFFSGYGAEAVAQRIADCEASLLVCANGFFRRGRQVPMLDDARRAAAASPSLRHLLVIDRFGESPLAGGRDGAHFVEVDYRALLSTAQPDATLRDYPPDQTLMLIYTSGTTGKPKGVVHTHSGFPFKAAQDLMMAFDFGADDTLMWITDMGWLMGPWMVYGGLLHGATIVLCEGTPDYPHPGRLWRIVQRHGVTHLGLSPSLVRLMMNHAEAVPAPETIGSLRVFGSTGEAWNEAPWVWLFEAAGGSRRPIINYSGGTEIGGGIIASFAGLPQKACSFSGPIPGMAVDVLGTDGRPVRGSVGELVIRQPWPGMTNGFWQDRARYEEAYWMTLPGTWVHGDWARIDEDGYWFVHGRSDDTIKIAGKRVGPADFESALVSHPLVAEAVAIGVPDEVKGESAVCFVTLRPEAAQASGGWAQYERELIEHVGAQLGKPLRPKQVHHVRQIPKTRNGKIVRRVMRAAYLGTGLGDLSSVENPMAIDEIQRLRAALARV